MGKCLSKIFLQIQRRRSEFCAKKNNLCKVFLPTYVQTDNRQFIIFNLFYFLRLLFLFSVYLPIILC